MRQILFGKDISPKCAYCETGKLSVFGNEILCKNMGVMQPDSCCKKFKYDPLKRTPKTLKINADFSKEDFKI